jgi:uncharacterized protein (DUF58 family)
MRWFASSSTGPGSDAVVGGEPLLTPALLGAVSGLELVSLARRRRSIEGAHPALRHGREEEFFQHRPYVLGDDLRAVDWRASARTGHPLLKERHQPSRRPLTLLIDTSASMAFPEESSKLRQAKVLSAALAFLALRRGDAVELQCLRGSRFEKVARWKPAPRFLHALSRVIAPLAASGDGDLPAALSAAGTSALRHGLVVVLSDLYGDEERLLSALSAIRRAAEVAVLHILSPAERRIPAGVPAVQELEGGSVVSLDGAALGAYASRVADWRQRLRAGARSAGADFQDADSGEPAVDILRRWLGRVP